MRRRLKDKLPLNFQSEELKHTYNSFDIIGDIAILKAANDNVANAEAVAKQILAVHRRVKTVFWQTGPILGDFRVRELKLAAGDGRTTTRYKESSCVFAVDVEKCYFSPRLSHERARIAALVKNGETVVNMFAGVGCFSVIIAKNVLQTKVYSIDVNPAAFRYMEENVRINRVYSTVIPLLGDSKDVIISQLQGKADRVLMPLPEKALEYLPYAISALKLSGGWIHLYDFQHAAGNENPVDKTKLNVAQKLGSLGVGYSFVFSRVVRSTGPNWYQTVLDIQVNASPSKF
ncbi:MAG TPA: class I SAM-dependent methyltransferase family protein [Candidatus Bathyarchaeia archaeon]|nr:class I SAM-dependent methyltransferase family protein [Candidatus Bathyarchaeia archaeon]